MPTELAPWLVTDSTRLPDKTTERGHQRGDTAHRSPPHPPWFHFPPSNCGAMQDCFKKEQWGKKTHNPSVSLGLWRDSDRSSRLHAGTEHPSHWHTVLLQQERSCNQPLLSSRQPRDGFH